MSEIEPETYIGKIFFFERGNTFMRVERIARGDAENSHDVFLIVTDLFDGHEGGMRPIEEIGDELKLIPDNYPMERIDQFLKAKKQKDAAEEIMLDVTYEVLMPDMYFKKK